MFYPDIFHVSGRPENNGASSIAETGRHSYGFDKLYFDRCLDFSPAIVDAVAAHVSSNNIRQQMTGLKKQIHEAGEAIGTPSPNLPVLIDEIKNESIRLESALNDLHELSLLMKDDILVTHILLKPLLEDICVEMGSKKTDNARFSFAGIKDNDLFTDLRLLRMILFRLTEQACSKNKPGQKVQVAFRAFKSNEGFCIRISDYGPGILPSSLDNVFNLPISIRIKKGSPEPGLYLVKSAVEKLGGTILLKSVYGSGSSYTLILPEC